MKDALLIRAYDAQNTERAPIWLMRQAGRYLPEYLELRKRYTMLEAIRTPKIAMEITLQPLERFEFDGSIIFADILTPLIGMGLKLDFEAGVGPRIYNPITTPADVGLLEVPPPDQNVSYTLEAIELTAKELEKRGIPLLGFSGAPFTLASYAIEGGSSKNLVKVKSFMVREPDAWRELMEKLTQLVTEYLVAQVNAGAAAVQLFDSWAGFLSPDEYQRSVAPYVKSIVKAFRSETGKPIVFFSTGTTGLLPQIKAFGVNAVGVDWRVSLPMANDLLGGTVPLQGNLDPVLLTGPWEPVEHAAKRILVEGRELPGHIFNLGHGIVPEAKIENVSKLVSLVRSFRA